MITNDQTVKSATPTSAALREYLDFGIELYHEREKQHYR